MTSDLLKRIRVLDPPMSRSRLSTVTNTNVNAPSSWSADNVLRQMEALRQYQLAEHAFSYAMFRRHGPRLLALRDNGVERLFHEIWMNRNDPVGTYVNVKPADGYGVLEMADLIHRVIIAEQVDGRVAHSFVYRLAPAGLAIAEDFYGDVA